MKVQDFFKTLQESSYLKFIEEKKKCEVQRGFEVHHIYPKSFEDGKIQEAWNLVSLSKADHLLAHILLFESLESLSKTHGKSYFSALGALHTAFKTRYERLGETERQKIKDKIQEMGPKWEQCRRLWQESAKKSREKRWGGNCMGACFTEEANRKRQKTKVERYGYGNGRLSQRDVIEKALQTRRERYSGDAMGQCRTEKALQKQRQTMMERYGRKYMITDPKVKARNRQVLREKYGTCTGAMNTVEAQEKARKAHQVTINRKKTVVRTEEFKRWYQGKESVYKHRPHLGVRDFLQVVGKELQDYPEFVQS